MDLADFERHKGGIVLNDKLTLPQNIIEIEIKYLGESYILEKNGIKKIIRSEENERTHQEEREQVGICIRSRH